MPKVARIFLFILVGLSWQDACLFYLPGCLLILTYFKGHLEKTASQALGMKQKSRARPGSCCGLYPDCGSRTSASAKAILSGLKPRHWKSGSG
jgi:hypothetical protein